MFSDTYGAASQDFEDSLSSDDAPLSSYGAADEAFAPSDNYGAAADEAAADEAASVPADTYDTAPTAKFDLRSDIVEAPVDNYGAASELDSAAAEDSYDDYDPSDVPSDQAAPPTYTGSDTGAKPEGDTGIKMLMNAVPGVPGEDYPIYGDVPETAFSCDGQVDGGYYADSEAECQVFHICTADGQGGLAKYSFLCPNGTIFNQNYFICDWWFNFDCSEAEGLFSKNDEIAAERAAIDAASLDAAASDAQADYAAPPALDAAAEYSAPREARQRSGRAGRRQQG